MAEQDLRSQISGTIKLNRFHPTPARWLHVTLFLIAFAGWLIFILACAGGPAWSPDGSQILFAYRDVANSRTSVALYDRATGKVSTIFALPAPPDVDSSSGVVALHPGWQKDGRRALVTIWRNRVHNSSDENACALVSLPVKSKLPVQVYNLGFATECLMGLPEVGGKVYFGGSRLNWIDLVTGEEGEADFLGLGDSKDRVEVQLLEQNGKLYYERHLKRELKVRPDQPQQENGVEFGRWQTQDPTLKPSFTLWNKDLSSAGEAGDVGGASDISFAPVGGQGALGIPEGDVEKILITEDGKGIVRVLDPGLDLKSYSLGTLVWSQDGKTLYAPVLTPGVTENTLNYELAEIPVAGGKARLTKIAVIHRAKDSELGSYLGASMQVSLGPDGRWIAATPAVVDKGLDDGDRALFLIDLHDPARHMQKVPIPPQTADGAAGPTARPEVKK